MERSNCPVSPLKVLSQHNSAHHAPVLGKWHLMVGMIPHASWTNEPTTLAIVTA